MSFYLKYRPQKIEELDLDLVRDELLKIVTANKFSHAYLFTGPKGTGKTSSARIIAKVLNCEKNAKKLAEPCNECETCKSITKGSSLAVMEMDAASNRGIDDIRQLRERVALAPADGKYSVYVIDEVHMLTTEAFNALLKTLEEPPEHAVFILCTTEAHKVPETIVSRCTKVRFYKASEKEVGRSLSKAILGEGLEIEGEGLSLIAKRVDGSFRDGMKILEQLAQNGKKISLEMIDKLTGFSDEYKVDEFLEALFAKEAKTALAELKKKEDLGVDFLVFGKRIVEGLRDRLLDRVIINNESTNLRVNELRELVELFSEAVLKIKTAVVAQLPLEVAIVEYCLGNRKEEIVNSREGDTIEQGEKKKEIVNSQKEEVPPQSGSSHPARIERAFDNAQAHGDDSISKLSDGPVSIEMIEGKWGEIMKAVKPHNHSLEALLRSTKPLKFEGSRLVIEVFYAFHKEQLEQERHRKTIEGEISKVMNSTVAINFVLGKKVPVKSVPAGEPNVTGKVEDEDLAKAAEEIFS